MRITCRGFALIALLGAVVILTCSCGAGSLTATPPAQPATPTATPAPPTAAPATAVATNTSLPPTPAPACDLSPVVAPTPASDPGYAQLDPSTGLHVTGEMQLLDLATYRLRVSGLVDHPLELTYDEIRCLPRLQDRPLLVCPDTFEDRATWAGASLREVLKLAGVQAGAQQVQFVAADGYKVTLSLERALQPTNFLAYEWEGEPLPRLHGFPLRVVLPDEVGAYWVKWLVEIHVQ
jgi:DMSO/TMAO reductase YedYZ molybdopterin-dependent catalytic subunit